MKQFFSADKKLSPIAGNAKINLFSEQSITIAGRTFFPDEDIGFIEFHLVHTFPQIIEGTAIHPLVAFKSYRSFENKIFNFGHMMKSYDPEIQQDRMLGTVLAVEFLPMNSGGQEEWKLDVTVENAARVRGVAVIHKAADGAAEILDESNLEIEWMVSMENTCPMRDCGFIVTGHKGLDDFREATPPNLLALGYTWVPAMLAPLALLKTVNNEDDDKKSGNYSLRIVREFRGQPVILLVGGIENKIRFNGVGLTPKGKDNRAMVTKMLASEKISTPTAEAIQALHGLADRILGR